ncbi:APC family permease [Novosphingobium sp. KACC 22771]|uniref:APC family permease n=1 Tax=Novosphingobium sp. KACC 22771 TaxID=3025670 RepID=UPI002365A3DA|nr:amino acid permease [Novosphingobium sp. KACC 22771]WDF71711.1 amino acid permease [Novosphingobium sp. KACC 22771]
MSIHQPQRHLHSLHAMLLALGMIMSTDALKTAPTIVASIGHWHFLGLWMAGAAISIVGGLSYVEMAAAFPDAGGEYSFIRRAWGERVGTLYAWSRFAIMHTGWVALMAHLAADYIGAPLGLGAGGRLVLSVGLVAAMTGLNLAHVRLGFLTQALLVLAVALGFISVILAGIVVPAAPVMPEAPRPHMGGIAVALIYIFLAYGGWSDAATLSAEVRSGRRGMFIAVIGSIGLLGVVYVALNWALMRGLGEGALAHSVAPAADLARMAFGWPGQALVVTVVGISAVASINSTIIVCARTTYAAARDHPGLGALAHWHPTRGAPTRAALAVGGVSLVLTLLSALTGSGFNAMVDYMTPVYWLFIGMGMAAAIRLRIMHPDLPRPVKTPLFPLFPAVFIALAAYMLYASFLQLGLGAVFGAGVLALGAGLDFLLRRRARAYAK